MAAHSVGGAACFLRATVKRLKKGGIGLRKERYAAWLEQNTTSLVGKTVAITGSTGGLGKALCRYLAQLGASLILVDRNASRSEALREALVREYGVAVVCIGADLEDMTSVMAATARLEAESIDVFIHNAGAYSIPRKICATGYDNVFQINFVSPYYMIRRLLPTLSARCGRVVVVGSIAHDYSETDPADIDFSGRPQASKAYGNAKRYLMFSMGELFKGEEHAAFSVTHPGISFTGITDHYPKWLFWLIKHPMKVLFMKPRKACLSILKGVFEPCGPCEWIGPWLFDVWGMPQKKFLHTCSNEEIVFIGETAQTIYHRLCEENSQKSVAQNVEV